MVGYGSTLNNEKPKGSFKYLYDEIDTKKLATTVICKQKNVLFTTTGGFRFMLPALRLRNTLTHSKQK